MKCPFCMTPDSRVIDTRPHNEGSKIKRRRLCEACGMRFTTFESIDRGTVWVIKRGGERQEFDTNKMLDSMVRACKKQSIALTDLKQVVSEFESKIYSLPEQEITTAEIGEFIMSKLLVLDEVTYIRFASVYKDFTDIDSFSREIKKISREKDKIKGEDRAE